TDGDPGPRSVELRLGDLPPETLRHGHGLLRGGAGKDDSELLAAEPADHVLGARFHAEERAQARQHLVPGERTVLLVDAGEIIDIDDGERHRTAQARRPPGLLSQPLLEVPVVVQASQAIRDDIGYE